MIIRHDPTCAEYAAPGHAEAPFRVLRTAEYLQGKHPDWFPVDARATDPVADKTLRLAHSAAHLARLRTTTTGMFDADTAALPDMDAHARRGVEEALVVAELALEGEKAFSLMRPPGHHATANDIMGFCYLNAVAVAALHARSEHELERVAVWDFDAHHGNGTEAILARKKGVLYVSVHQFPCYPGTGEKSSGNVKNYPVAPGTSPEEHMQRLETSWTDILDFEPDLVLVSAGFDAYQGDPLTQMTLRLEDYATLGRWLNDTPCPVGAILEGGYSPDLPQLVGAFLEAWEGAA